MNSLKWYIGTLHVTTSNRVIIRDLYNRMKNLEYTREQRKTIYRMALQYHKENKELFNFVMG